MSRKPPNFLMHGWMSSDRTLQTHQKAVVLDGFQVVSAPSISQVGSGRGEEMGFV